MTSPRCRLFMVTTGLNSADQASKLLPAALAEGDVASVLVKAGPGQRAIAQAIMPPALAKSVAVLIENDADLAAQLGADGVQVPAAAVTETRRRLGAAVIVGGDCGSSRHAAMTAGEAGADYVGFSGIDGDAGEGSVIAWWASLFEVPCVALDQLPESEARQLVLEGADFITPPATMWVSEAAAAQVVRTFNSMIDECTK